MSYKVSALELIFIHLAKTAGSSLRALLHRIYGREAVVTVGVDVSRIQNAIHESMLPTGTKVLTGHISYAQAEALHHRSGAKIVSFLRDPIERYISHYFHLKRPRIRSLGLQHQLHSWLPIWGRLCLTRYHKVINRSLEPLPLKRFDFIGFHHTFRDDIFTLAYLIHWPKATLTAWGSLADGYANVNKECPEIARTISKAALTLIRLANTDDAEVYTQTLVLRESSVCKELETVSMDTSRDKS